MYSHGAVAGQKIISLLGKVGGADRQYNVLNGVTNISTELQHWLTELATSKDGVTSGVLVVEPGTYRIGTDVTVPAGITVKMDGGEFSIDSGKTLTVNGTLDLVHGTVSGAGSLTFASGSSAQLPEAKQCFDVSSGLTVTFASGVCPVYTPAWTGFSTSATATTNTTALQAIFDALQSVGGDVLLPQGTYPLNGQVTFYHGIRIRGAGCDKTVLDWSAATGTFTNFSCLYVAGSLTQIEDLSSDVSAGDFQLTFASTPTLSAEDVFVIYNPSDYSFSSARSYYRAGEWCRVKSVSGTTVTLYEPVYADYTAANVDIYKLSTAPSVELSDFSAVFKSDQTGINLDRVRDSKVSSLKLRGSSVSNLTVRGYNLDISEVDSRDVNTPSGSNYGLTISNSQAVRVRGGHYNTSRHGITLGGDDSIGCVPNRDVLISNALVSNNNQALGGILGMNLHGNVEFISFQSCIFPNGVSFAGDKIQLHGCMIRQVPASVALYATEMLGASVEIVDCRIEAVSNVQTSHGLIDVQGLSGLSRGGTFIIDNCSILMGKYTGRAVYVYYNATQADVDFVFSNNKVRASATAVIRDIVFEAANDKDYRSLIIKNNHIVEVESNAKKTSPQLMEVSGNAILNSQQYGFSTTPNNSPTMFTTQHYVFRNNTIINSQAAGIYALGDVTATTLDMIGNTIINNGTSGTGDSTTRGSFYLSDFLQARVENNMIGDNRSPQLQLRNYSINNITSFYERGNHSVGLVLPVVEYGTVNQLGAYTDRSARREVWESAVPTTRTWSVGDLAHHYDAAAGEALGWLCTTAGTPGAWTSIPTLQEFSVSWNPPNLVHGTSATQTVVATGVGYTDYVVAVSTNGVLQDLILTAYVSGTDQITFILLNTTGSDVNLGTQTFYCVVFKR